MYPFNYSVCTNDTGFGKKRPGFFSISVSDVPINCLKSDPSPKNTYKRGSLLTGHL